MMAFIVMRMCVLRLRFIAMAVVAMADMLVTYNQMAKVMIMQTQHGTAGRYQQAIYSHHQYEAVNCAFPKHAHLEMNTGENCSLSMGSL
jgi:hypothetical protein